MSAVWEGEDEKIKELIIPGMALPSLRDLKVQFVALIEFDLFMGPIFHICEIKGGSSYIKQLRISQTHSEIYAGVARSDVNILTTPEDSIAVFRIVPPNGDADVPTVFLISCISGSKMDHIRKIGSSALFKSKGDPTRIGTELSVSLRELQSTDEEFSRFKDKSKIRIMVEDRLKKALELDFIKGFTLIDLESKIADFRLFPIWYNGSELKSYQVLQFLDNQFESISEGKTSTMLFQSLILMMTKVSELNIYFVLLIGSSDISKIEKIGTWINKTSSILSSEWRFSSLNEIKQTLNMFNSANKWVSPEDFLKKYVRMAMRCERIKPIKTDSTELSLNKISKPDYLSTDIWNMILTLEGNHSIYSLSNLAKTSVFEMIRILEWANTRNLLDYLQE